MKNFKLSAMNLHAPYQKKIKRLGALMLAALVLSLLMYQFIRPETETLTSSMIDEKSLPLAAQEQLIKIWAIMPVELPLGSWVRLEGDHGQTTIAKARLLKILQLETGDFINETEIRPLSVWIAIKAGTHLRALDFKSTMVVLPWLESLPKTSSKLKTPLAEEMNI